MKNRKRSQEPKSKPLSPAKLASQCVKWFKANGFFAVKMFVDGAMLVLAIKEGKPYIICTDNGKSGQHDPKGVASGMARAGAQTYCVNDIESLAEFIER